MTLPCETGHGNAVCEDCGSSMPLQVCHSAAGYYIGTMCNCGPYSRESGYYKTMGEADTALEKDTFDR